MDDISGLTNRKLRQEIEVTWGMVRRYQDSSARDRVAIAELVATGRAVVDRWDSPQWKDLPNIGESIADLRATIEKHEQQPQGVTL